MHAARCRSAAVPTQWGKQNAKSGCDICSQIFASFIGGRILSSTVDARPFWARCEGVWSVSPTAQNAFPNARSASASVRNVSTAVRHESFALGSRPRASGTLPHPSGSHSRSPGSFPRPFGTNLSRSDRVRELRDAIYGLSGWLGREARAARASRRRRPSRSAGPRCPCGRRCVGHRGCCRPPGPSRSRPRCTRGCQPD